MADEKSGPDAGDPGDHGPADKKSDAPDGSKLEQGDEKLGDAGLKALHAERDARKALEQELSSIKQALAGIGGAPDDGKQHSVEETVSSLQSQLEQMRHETEAMRIVAKHKISDEDDVKLVLAQSTPDAMSALAARLAPADGDSPQVKRTPKPDPSVGRGGSEDERATGTVAAGRDLWLERHPQKTTK